MILYLGKEKVAHEVYEKVYVHRFKVQYKYYDKEGKEVVLRCLKDCYAYPPMRLTNPSHVVYPLALEPMCRAGELYPISVLHEGYHGYNFELEAL